MLILADTSWSGIVIAALGSSAIGAIVGGYITTWLRGRIERDEAMRNRLIECADEFVDSMTNALLAFDAATLMDTAGGRRKLRNTTGELLDDVVECLKSARSHSEKAHTALTRVELLYGSEASGPYDDGLKAADCLRGGLALVEGKGTTQAAVRAVVAYARDDVHEYNRLVRSAPSTSRRARALLDIGLPRRKEFNPDDDSSIASWALALRSAATSELHAFVRDAQRCIRARHPADPKSLQGRAAEGWQARLGSVRGLSPGQHRG